MWQGAAHRLFLRFTTPSTMKLNSNNMHIVYVTRSFTPLRLNAWIYHWILNSDHVWSFIWIEAHQCYWCGWRVHLIYDICTLICTRVCTRKCTCVYTHTLACPSVGSYPNKYIFKYSSSHHAYTCVFRDSQLVYEIIETDSQKYDTLLWAWNRGRKNKPKFMLSHIMICESVGSYPNKHVLKYSSSQHAYTHVYKNSQLVYKNVETDSQKYETLLWAWNRGRKNKPKFMLYHIMICQSVGSYPNKYIFKYSSFQHAYTRLQKFTAGL